MDRILLFCGRGGVIPGVVDGGNKTTEAKVERSRM